MKLVSIIDLHIGRSVFFATLLVLAVLFFLMSFIVFVDGLDDIGKGEFGLLQLFRFVLLSQPKNLHELFPTAALLGSTVGLSFLAANSEIVAMRAAGVSVWRIAGSVMKIGMLFVLLGIVIGEFVAPVSEDMAQTGRAEAMEVSFRGNTYSGVWFRNNSEFVNIGEVLPDHTLLRLNIFRFTAEKKLESQIYANRAEYIDKTWNLIEVRETRFSDDRIEPLKHDVLPWSSGLPPEEMAVHMVQPEGLSVVKLGSYIQHLKENRQQTSRYELVFWRKLLNPVAMAVMLLLAIPFVFGQTRGGAMGYRLFLGVLAALAFNMLNLLSGHTALLYGVNPAIGAVIPVVAFLLLAVFLLRRAA